MVGLQILLVCVSINGLEVLADKDLQPYGPKMCKSLCSRMKCSDSIFYEVKLICKLHFPTEPREVALSKFNNSKATTAGFFVQTKKRLYYFDNSLKIHMMTLTGLPRLKLPNVIFGYEKRSLYVFAKGILYIAAFKKYTAYFPKKKIYIKVLKNKPIETLALDQKNKILATIYSTSGIYMTLGLFSLERSHLFKTLVKKPTKVTNLCIDKQNRLVFYINRNGYISSIDYKGQTTTKYGRVIQDLVIQIEVKGETITWYTCFGSQPVRYRYDMRSKKTTRKKFDMLRPCLSSTYLIIVGDKIVKATEIRTFVEIKSFGNSMGISYPLYESIDRIIQLHRACC